METQATKPILLNTLASTSLKFDLPNKVTTTSFDESKIPTPATIGKPEVDTKASEVIGSSLNSKINDEQILKKTELALNEALFNNLNQKIGFDKDEKTGKTIIVIKDKETDEVIKQIPPQHFLDLVYSLNKAASVVLKDLPRYA